MYCLLQQLTTRSGCTTVVQVGLPSGWRTDSSMNLRYEGPSESSDQISANLLVSGCFWHKYDELL